MFIYLYLISYFILKKKNKNNIYIYIYIYIYIIHHNFMSLKSSEFATMCLYSSLYYKIYYLDDYSKRSGNLIL